MPAGSPGAGGPGYQHGNVIQLSAGNYILATPDNFWFGPNALPPIASDIVIIGDPAGTIIERSQQTYTPAFRLFYVGGGESLSGYNAPNVASNKLPGPGELTLKNLTVRYGYIEGGNSSSGGGGMGAGGAIYNQGTLVLDGVTVSNNFVRGGFSEDTSAGNGGGGISGNAPANGGSGGGFTGALWPSSSSAPASSFGNGGQGGIDGGAGANGTDGANGGTGGGGGGAGGHGGSGSTMGGKGADGGFGGGGGSGGFGGGGTNNGTGGNGGFGGGAGGGFPSGAGGFGGGNSSQDYFGGGGAAFGGAVFNDGGTVTAVNSTFANNLASGGGSGFGDGGNAFGGAIFNLDGTITLRYATLAYNDVHGGSNPNSSASVAAAGGGAVYNLYYPNPGSPGADGKNAARVTVDSSILAGTTNGEGTVESDCENNAGTFTGGFDVVETPGTCSFGNNDQNADPQFATTSLTANGGPTLTLALDSTSPAINHGDTETLLGAVPTRDQRGFLRDSKPDVGAYEYGASPIELNPDLLDFGNQPVGSKSGILSVAIKNISTGTVTLTGVSFSETNALAFSLAANNCQGKILVPYTGCTLDFRFEPFAAGISSVIVTISTNQHTQGTLTLKGDGTSSTAGGGGGGGGALSLWNLLGLLMIGLIPVAHRRSNQA